MLRGIHIYTHHTYVTHIIHNTCAPHIKHMHVSYRCATYLPTQWTKKMGGKKKKDKNLNPKNDRKVKKKWYNRKIRSKKLESEK